MMQPLKNEVIETDPSQSFDKLSHFSRCAVILSCVHDVMLAQLNPRYNQSHASPRR